MATIQRRQSKRTGEVTYRVGARIDRKLTWTPPIQDADTAVEIQGIADRLGLAAAIAIMESRAGKQRGVRTLEDELEAHLEEVEGYAARGTAPEYRRVAERSWLPRLGKIPLEALTSADISEWVAWQRKQETEASKKARAKAKENKTEAPERKNWSAKSIKNAHGLLSSVLNRAEEAGRVSRNVARGVKLPKDEQQREMEIFTTAEFAKFLGAMHRHYLPLTLFLVDTACRIGEASAVQVRDFDLDGDMPTVTIRRGWKHDEVKGQRYLGSAKSRRANRTIVLNPLTVEAIKPLFEGKGVEDYVFTTVRGKIITDNYYNKDYFKPALEKAGITKRLSPHCLRHTSASWQLMQGVPAQVVQHRLGHESLQTTSKTYAHLLVDAQLSAINVLGKALGRTDDDQQKRLPA